MKKEYIIIRESMAVSFVNDLTTFGMMTAVYWINYRFIGDSNFMKGLLLIMLMVLVAAKPTLGKWSFNSKEDAIKHIEKL